MVCVVLFAQAGKIPADSQVGRSLMQVVSTVPEIDPAKFESLINSGMQVCCVCARVRGMLVCLCA